MATDCIAQVTFAFQGLRQPVVARFDQAHASSDGGAVLLKALDDRLGVTRRLAASLTDRRQPGKVQHELIEAGPAAGLRDRLRLRRLQRRRPAGRGPDPQAAARARPAHGPALASQPTLSRFENAVGRPALYLASVALADWSSSTIARG